MVLLAAAIINYDVSGHAWERMRVHPLVSIVVEKTV